MSTPGWRRWGGPGVRRGAPWRRRASPPAPRPDLVILRERLHSLGYRAAPRPRDQDLRLEEIATRLGAEVRENRHGAALVVEELLRLPRLGAYDSAVARLL